MSRAWAGHPCKYLICPSPGETSKATSKLAPFSKGVTHGKRALQIESSSGCAKAKVLTNSQNWGARDWPKSLWGELFWAPRGPPQCLDLERMWILMIFLASAIQPFQFIIWWTSMSSFKARSRMRRIQMDGRGSSILHYIEKRPRSSIKTRNAKCLKRRNFSRIPPFSGGYCWKLTPKFSASYWLDRSLDSTICQIVPKLNRWTKLVKNAKRYIGSFSNWSSPKMTCVQKVNPWLYLVTLGRYSATLLRPRSTS